MNTTKTKQTNKKPATNQKKTTKILHDLAAKEIDPNRRSRRADSGRNQKPPILSL